MAIVNSDWATICGAYCGSCEDLDECGGCGQRIARMPSGTCERYVCCTQTKQLEHCGLCDEFPCAKFDVNCTGLPEDVFRQSRDYAIQALRRRTQLGTLAWLRAVHVSAGSD